MTQINTVNFKRIDKQDQRSHKSMLKQRDDKTRFTKFNQSNQLIDAIYTCEKDVNCDRYNKMTIFIKFVILFTSFVNK